MSPSRDEVTAFVTADKGFMWLLTLLLTGMYMYDIDIQVLILLILWTLCLAATFQSCAAVAQDPKSRKKIQGQTTNSG